MCAFGHYLNRSTFSDTVDDAAGTFETDRATHRRHSASLQQDGQGHDSHQFLSPTFLECTLQQETCYKISDVISFVL